MGEALAVPAGGEVLAVPSGGDAVLALALSGARVTVVSPEPLELALVALKVAGGVLAWEEHRQLLGLDAPGRRVFLYHRARGALLPETRRFWDDHEHLVRAGVLNGGEVEARLARLARALDWTGREEALEAWWSEGDPRRREVLYDREIDGSRWRIAIGTLGTGWCAVTGGRLVAARPRWAHGEAARRWRASFVSARGRDNPYLGRLVRPAEAALPRYLTRTGHSGLGEASARVTLVRGTPIDALAGSGPRFDGFLLGVPDANRWSELVEALRRRGRPGARIVLRGPATGTTGLHPLVTEAERLAARERSPLAGRLQLLAVPGVDAR